MSDQISGTIEQTLTSETENKLTAKEVTKRGYILAIIFIIVMSLLRAFLPLFTTKELGLTVNEIIAVGGAIIGCCMPIAGNILADKFKRQ